MPLLDNESTERKHRERREEDIEKLLQKKQGVVQALHIECDMSTTDCQSVALGMGKELS